MMEETVNQYEGYIEVLSHRATRARLAAYTGEMIAMSAELNQLFGRTKGKLDLAIWNGHTEAYGKAVVLFEETWREFASRFDSGHADPTSGGLTTTNIRNAVEALRATLEGTRESAARLGIVSWVY